LRTAYEDSPISYYKKGHLVDIRAGALVKLNLHKNIEQILTFKIGYSYIQIKINQIIWIESLVTI